ncbi:MAG: hypothetical protein ACP5KK_03480, partial [Candidatus Nanoarchaeia archaeon]
GYIAVYNYQKKKFLYLNGRKNYNYALVKPIVFSRFWPEIPFNREEYKTKKAKAFKARLSVAIQQMRAVQGDLSDDFERIKN